MQTASNPGHAHPDDEIDLRQLVGVLWKQKMLIVALGVLGGVLGAGASLLSTKYVSDGLFLTPGLSAANYKRFENVLSNGVRLQQFLHNSGQADTADGKLLHELAENPDALSDALAPEFAFTDKDEKAFGVRVPEDDQAGAVVGVRVRFKHSEPTGGTPATLLSEFVRETVIRVTFENRMLSQCAQYRTKEQQLRNEQIANDFAIRQEEQRAATLRELIASNPDAVATDSRQIVSVEKGNERFLSPASQLVASEIQISDMKLAEARRERARTESALKREYYCQAQQALQQPISGRDFIGQLATIQEAVFQGQDQSIDIVEQTWNALDIERANWNTTYLSGMRFVASPEGAEIRERKPGLKLGIVLGGLVGGMFGVLAALVRAWWRNEADEASGRV